MEMNSTFGGSSACTVVPIRETNNANATLNVDLIQIPFFKIIVAIVAIDFADMKAGVAPHYYSSEYVWR